MADHSGCVHAPPALRQTPAEVPTHNPSARTVSEYTIMGPSALGKDTDSKPLLEKRTRPLEVPIQRAPSGSLANDTTMSDGRPSCAAVNRRQWPWASTRLNPPS